MRVRNLANMIHARLALGNERGQGMLEYGLIISFVALVVIFALIIFGPKVANLYNAASNSMNL